MLEGEVSGQGLKVCQSDLPSGLVKDISEGEPIIRVGHETCLLPSDINILEVVVSVRVGHEACHLATRPTGPQGSPGPTGPQGSPGPTGLPEPLEIGCFIVLNPLQLLFIVQRIFWVK